MSEIINEDQEVVSEPRRPFEDWAKAKKISTWQLAAARAHENWPAGREVTEVAFDQAVHQACNVALR